MILLGDVDTKYKIFEAIASSKKVMTLSEISKKLKMDQQRVSYHLPQLIECGLILKDGYNYFPQPIFVDDRVRHLCEEKLSDVVNGFSDLDIPVVVPDGQTKEDVVIECLYALIKLVMPKQT